MRRVLITLTAILATSTTTTTTTTEAFAVLPTRASNHAAVVEFKKTSNTKLNFGIPDMFLPKEEEEDDDDDNVSKTNNKKKTTRTKQDDNKTNEKNKIGLAGIVQLITAGAGAPFLGEFQGVDEETGKYMFSLEANNLVDEKGNSKQTQMPFFENGWVDPADEARAKEGFKFPWQK